MHKLTINERCTMLYRDRFRCFETAYTYPMFLKNNAFILTLACKNKACLGVECHYAPNFEKVGRAYCFRLVCLCVCEWVRLLVTFFKLLNGA